MHYFHWRIIFYLLLSLGLVGYIWFKVRMPESLPDDKRLPLSVKRIKEASIETLRHKSTMAYTIASGIIFAAFIGYLTSSAQIFKDVFDQEKNFPYLFGTLALAIGVSSFFNSKFVVQYGMKKLTNIALNFLFLFALVYLIVLSFGFQKNLILFIIYMLCSFFCIGILFGNFNALAISPLGHIAGVATAIISSIQTLIFLIIGTFIGQSFNGTVYPLVISFFILSIISKGILFKFTDR